MDKNKLVELPFPKLDHIGVIVRDMDKAIQHYQSLGIGPFEHVKNIVPLDRRIWDKPTKLEDIKLKIRMAKMVPVNIELIQPVAGESPWKEFLDSKGEGISHLGFYVDNIEEEMAKLKQKGFRALMSAQFKYGGGAAYFDTAGVGWGIIELVQWPAE